MHAKYEVSSMHAKYEVSSISYGLKVMVKVKVFCHRVIESQTDRVTDRQTRQKLYAPNSIPGGIKGYNNFNVTIRGQSQNV